MEKIRVKTARMSEFVDISGRVRSVVEDAGVKDGICVVFCPHTTAGLTINENADPSVKSDISNAMDGLVPRNGAYDHAEGNSDGHIKSSLFGQSLSLIIDGGRLQLGTWQGIMFCEFDGPRDREVWVKILRSG